MSKLIIDYPHAACEQIETLDAKRVTKYQPVAPHTPIQPNPEAWGLGPYERYLRIYVDMAMPFRPNVVTVDREVCEVKTYHEGTLSECYDVQVKRRTTTHWLSGDELGSVWPEIEMRKQEGVKLEISKPLSILRDPYSVVSYTGV